MSMKPRNCSIALRAITALVTTSLVVPPLAAQTATPRPATRAAGHSPALKSGTLVTLNFVNADIEAVTRAMGAMLDRQFIVDPRVRGNITVYSETPLSVREAYLNYLAALRGLGFTVVENAGLLKVVPEADAKLQAGTVSIGNVQQRGDQILTQIFRLNHENPNNLVAVLRPLISPNNTINANPGSNTLVITDYADNLTRLGKIIAALDQPAASEIEVVPLKHGLASDMAPLVQRLADSSASAIPGAQPGSGTGSVSVIADARSNSLIVRVTNIARQAQVRAIIGKLDLPTQGGGPGGSIWVIHLKNADAAKLATVLRAAFATTGGGGASGGFPTSTALVGATPGQPGGATAATAPLQASTGPSTGGFIQADPSTNSLIVSAAEPLYRQVRAMVEQLDSRRAQVYIESMIVEVSGDNAADFGFQWQGLFGNRGDKNLIGAGSNFGTGSGNIININTSAASGTVALGEGLNIGLVRNFGGTYALAAIARMLQTQANTNIISTPNLITLDNEEAKIVVGSNVPFITGQFTNTGTGATNPFQTIERKDVGLTLRIKPQIGEGGTVRLSIYQESSSVQSTAAVGTSNAGPSTNKRSIESNVVVDDGSIIVLGGLIEDRYADNNAQVPLLGDLPLVGNLFRSQSRTKTRTNLMVFLRPVVLRDGASTDKLSLDRYDLIRAQQKDAQPPQSVVVPVNNAPIMPPLRADPATVPASAPKTN